MPTEGYALGQAYAPVHGLRCPEMRQSRPWPQSEVQSFVEDSPIIVDELDCPKDGTEAYPGHGTIITGYFGSGVQMDIVVYDPMPPNVGGVNTIRYSQRIDEKYYLMGRGFILPKPVPVA